MKYYLFIFYVVFLGLSYTLFSMVGGKEKYITKVVNNADADVKIVVREDPARSESSFLAGEESTSFKTIGTPEQYVYNTPANTTRSENILVNPHADGSLVDVSVGRKRKTFNDEEIKDNSTLTVSKDNEIEIS